MMSSPPSLSVAAKAQVGLFQNKRKKVKGMNTTEYIGRLVTEPTLNRKANMEEEHYWSRIRIAVPRKFKKDKEKETDFFNCLFFGQAMTH